MTGASGADLEELSSGDSLEVLFVLDPLHTLDPSADSTHVMIAEALRRGHRPWGVGLGGLGLQGSTPFAHCVPLGFGFDAARELVTLPIIATGAQKQRELESFDVVLMRKDPPVDADYIAATLCLDRVRGKTLVLNDPRGLRDLNEKLAILEFEDLIPHTALLRTLPDLKAFMHAHAGTMVLKPLYGFGGREILLAREDDANLGSILELAIAEGKRFTVAQAYIPEASRGDKRILLLDGEPVGAVLRVAAPGQLRNNFHAGGRPERTTLTKRDSEICARVGPFARERGQFFVGIDVLGDFLSEINVTSPTGMQEINQLYALRGNDTMQARFWYALEAKLGLASRT